MVNYDKIPKSFRRLKFDTLSEFWLLVDIYEVGKYYKKITNTAEELGVSRYCVMRALARLTDKGYITKEWDQKLRRHVYRVCADQSPDETKPQGSIPVTSDDWSPLD